MVTLKDFMHKIVLNHLFSLIYSSAGKYLSVAFFQVGLKLETATTQLFYLNDD